VGVINFRYKKEGVSTNDRGNEGKKKNKIQKQKDKYVNKNIK